MSNLNLQKLSELCTLYSGGTPSTSNESYWNGNLNWMSSGETSNKLIYGTKLKITEKGVAESSTRLAHSGDTVVATAGEGKTRGQTSYLLTDTYVNQSIVVLKADKTKIDNKFLFYAVSNSYNRMRTLSDAAGIRGSLPCKLLNNFEINTFNLEIENKIGQFLFNIDLKIENNNKINAELESLAKTIYDYWFLQFEFPNEEGKPYKSSGGKMVWNEELKREIPEGWEVKTFKELANLTNGKRPNSKTNIQTKDFNIPIVGASSIMAYTNEFNYASRILIIGRVGSLGIVQRYNQPCWASDNTLIIKSELFEYIYQFLKITNFNKLNRGTTQPLITMNDVNKLPILFPSNNLAKIFENLITPLMNKVESNNRLNIELSSLRDFLLPMLMNGQITFR